MQFVFCILFFKAFGAIEKVFSKCFNKFDVHSFIISNIRPLRGGGGGGASGQRPKFYFVSDIAKVFPFIPNENEQMGHIWINSMEDFKEICCDVYLELPLFNTIKPYER